MKRGLKNTFQSIDDVYWTEDAADEDMMNTYCWMYGHLNLPHDYMVVIMIMMINGDNNMVMFRVIARDETQTQQSFTTPITSE